MPGKIFEEEHKFPHFFEESFGIDLYVSVLQYKYVKRNLQNNGYHNESGIMEYEVNSLYNNSFEGMSRRCTDRGGVSSAFAFIKHEPDDASFVVKVMIMDIAVNPLKAVASYDFSFLMNYCNGEVFHVWFPMDIIMKQGFYNQVLPW